MVLLMLHKFTSPDTAFWLHIYLTKVLDKKSQEHLPNKTMRQNETHALIFQQAYPFISIHIPVTSLMLPK